MNAQEWEAIQQEAAYAAFWADSMEPVLEDVSGLDQSLCQQPEQDWCVLDESGICAYCAFLAARKI